ncbi:MAG TPA: hypothetical protein VGS96_01980 [Thermoanaerobaculia bacterium]|jgi:hypothetical protein|nr:hypothetical protein [Thermoanaerobaculia bacterium]
MDGRTLIKLLIAAAVLLFLWKKGLPWLNERQAAKTSTTTSKGTNCVIEARSASEFFGSNIRAFANPPYDMTAWTEFKSTVDEHIGRADDKCSCGDDSCTHAKEAMSELRRMVGDVDAMIRSGSPPPSDIVQRQERVDDALNAAAK